MACTSQYATALDFSQFFSLSINVADAGVLAEVNRILTLAAADVHAPLAAVGACNCVSAAWALEYLKKLNIIDAAVVYNVSCGPQISTEERRMWLEWLDKQFARILSGEIDLCGQTGATYPAVGSIQHNLTDWSAARIIQNRIQRTGS